MALNFLFSPQKKILTFRLRRMELKVFLVTFVMIDKSNPAARTENVVLRHNGARETVLEKVGKRTA